jgi:hypothetical protein
MFKVVSSWRKAQISPALTQPVREQAKELLAKSLLPKILGHRMVLAGFVQAGPIARG